MKPLFAILIALVASASAASTNDVLFNSGQAAYDEGRYDEAISCYESLLGNGVVNAEVHYNLANAYFKSGNLPPAVRHYRTAWYSAPRDPDIRANLHFALNAAGVIEPAPASVTRLLTTLSRREWGIAGMAGYLLLSALLILSILAGRARPTLLRLCVVPAVILLFTAAGWWQWRDFRIHPEAVVVKPGVTALFGPVEGATAHYKLPAGALVRVRTSDAKGWIEVKYDKKRGWIKMGDILSLSP